MKLTFLGAAHEVTGSCYLVEAPGVRFVVDCGMFQGDETAYERNLNALTFDPKSLDFVLLTHAHIDHCGLLPRLCAFGYSGPIYTTGATADLIGYMLPDSAHIQEMDALRDNKRAWKQGKPIKAERAPLYTVAQAERALKQVSRIDYDQALQPHPSVRCVYREAGHILGAAMIEVWVHEGEKEHKIAFSGDIGPTGRPIVRDVAPITEADVLLVESTYGNRKHKDIASTVEELAHAVTDTITRKRGNVIMPAFAIGRAQEIIFLLFDLARKGRLPRVDVFVDSPLARAATEITMKHLAIVDPETRELFEAHDRNSLPIKLHFVGDAKESMRLNSVREGAIIISSSGMCEAGRIRHHLRHNLNRPECSIVFSGYQGTTTLGRRIVDGADKVWINGEQIEVKADIYTLGGLSAHADRDGLITWMKNFESPPKHVFCVHGDDEVAEIFANDIHATYGWNAKAPKRRHVLTI